MAFDATQASALLKQYVKTELRDSALIDHPGLAWLPKDEKAGGLLVRQPVSYIHTINAGHVASTTFASDKASTSVDFQITLANLYGRALIAGYILEAAEGKDKAWADMKHEMQQGMLDTGNVLSRAAWGDGSASIGRLTAASDVTTATVTLRNRSDIKNIEPGMVLQTSSTNTGSTANTGTVTVDSVDWAAGSFTVEEASVDTGIASAASSDYVFRSGNKGQAFQGINAWIPDSAPGGSDSFLNVNRSGHPRLYGLRLDGAGKAVDEILEDGLTELRMFGKGGELAAFVNPTGFGKVSKALGGGKEYADVDTGGIGFKALKVRGGGSIAYLMEDPDVPDDKCFILNKNTWKMYSTGKVPKLFDRDGVLLRVSGADNYEARMGGFVGVGCSDPGSNLVITNFGS